MGNSSSSLPSLTTWVPGDNSKKKKPFIEIVYIQRILSFVAEEAFEAVRLSSVCRDWRDAVQNYSDEMWFNICRGIQNEPGFQSVFLRVCHTDLLVWVLRCCYRQRDAKHIRSFLGEDAQDQAMLPIDFRFVKSKPALVVAVAAGQPEITKLLIELGADVNLQAVHSTLAGLSPLEICLKNITNVDQKNNNNNNNTDKNDATVDPETMKRYVSCLGVLIKDGAAFKKAKGDSKIQDFFEDLLGKVLVFDLRAGASMMNAEDFIFDTFLDNPDFTENLKKVASYHVFFHDSFSLLHIAILKSYIRVSEWILKKVESEVRDFFYSRNRMMKKENISNDNQRKKEEEMEFIRQGLKGYVNVQNREEQTIIFPPCNRPMTESNLNGLLTFLDRFPPESNMIDIYHIDRVGRNVLCHIASYWEVLACVGSYNNNNKNQAQQNEKNLLRYVERLLQLYGSGEKFVGHLVLDLSPNRNNNNNVNNNNIIATLASASAQHDDDENDDEDNSSYLAARSLTSIRYRNTNVPTTYPSASSSLPFAADKGRNALMIACERKHCAAEFIRLLLKYSLRRTKTENEDENRNDNNNSKFLFDINQKDATGMTALHHAVNHCDLEKVKLLVEEGGADVNVEAITEKKNDRYTGYGSDESVKIESDSKSGQNKNDDKSDDDVIRQKPIDLIKNLVGVKENAGEVVAYLRNKMEGK